MNVPRLQITSGMRSILDYRKFVGSTRMLVLETGYFFERSWLRAADSLGWETATAPSAMAGDISREDVARLFTTISEFKPDFILASNYAGMDFAGLFARFFEDARIPYVSWFTDSPRMILYEHDASPSYYTVAATWEKAYEPHFRQLGFEHVFHMPLATDLSLFDGSPSQACERPLAFVGTSMIELANEAWRYVETMHELACGVLEAFSQGRVTREAFASGIGTILSPQLLAGRAPNELRQIELCMLYEATQRHRAELAVRLAPLGLCVRGDLAWREILQNTEGPVGYFDDLAPFYRSTLINVNNTSLQMRTAVNQRVFDCPAAGGFLITDDQPDLHDFFDPLTELVTYASLDELEEKTVYFLRHPDVRVPIVERARARIEAEHTHTHRLLSLEGYLRERFA